MTEHIVMWVALAALMPTAIGAAMFGNRIHVQRHARGACGCEEGKEGKAFHLSIEQVD